MSINMDEKVQKKKIMVEKQRILRCLGWLEKQNSDQPSKLSQQNKNDIQFIIQNHAARKNFLLAVAEDDATVPNGVAEPSIEPRKVPIRKLRVAYLQLECEWQSCKTSFTEYEQFQKHVRDHSSEMHVIENGTSSNGVEYVCLWDVCGFKTTDYEEAVRHMNYHAYHGKLLAIGLNGRATLNLARCKRDSRKRNHLPKQSCDYSCMWNDCEASKFNSFQVFLDHVHLHTSYAEVFQCTWAGCGAKFNTKVNFIAHVRTHTGERLVACYHCGLHFANNRKLSDHTRRQNVVPNSPYICKFCGNRYATEYLLSEHSRQHISTYACTMCDMSATSRATLAAHMRYRHLNGKDTRLHSCPECPYKAITKWDLKKHVLRHKKKQSKKCKKREEDFSDEDDSDNEPLSKKKKSPKKYACHMCPEKEMKIFSRGNRLTTHLVKAHGAQWSYGHSRFRYQISEDGMYRLTTTRYESLEVSTKIMDGYSGPNESLTNFEFNVEQVAEATDVTPRNYEITLKNDDDKIAEPVQNEIEIVMCDVDEKGNIISSELINNDVIGKLKADT